MSRCCCIDGTIMNTNTFDTNSGVEFSREPGSRRSAATLQNVRLHFDLKEGAI